MTYSSPRGWACRAVRAFRREEGNGGMRSSAFAPVQFIWMLFEMQQVNLSAKRSRPLIDPQAPLHSLQGDPFCLGIDDQHHKELQGHHPREEDERGARRDSCNRWK